MGICYSEIKWGSRKIAMVRLKMESLLFVTPLHLLRLQSKEQDSNIGHTVFGDL